MTNLFIMDIGKTWSLSLFRQLFAFIDYIIYSIIRILFKVMFQLANFELVGFYEEILERIYVILGIFMLFKVTISLVTYLVNPDKISDKEQGASKLVTRILTVLVMLIALPNVFSLLTEFQNVALPVIPKIVIGTAYENDTDAMEKADSVGNSMAISMVNGFAHVKTECIDDVNTNFTNLEDFLTKINNTCTLTEGGKKIYAYDYIPVVSTIVGIIMCYVVVSLNISVAIRAFKLIILRAIAPIPIVSYIDPKSSKDGTFATWVKTFISVWAELFMFIGIIYFIIFIIDYLLSSAAWTGFFSSSGIEASDIVTQPFGAHQLALFLAFIIIGLLFFAKQAPKFVMDALGIKSKGNFMRMLGMGVTAAGGIGSAASAFRARQEYDRENRPGENHTLRNLGSSLFSGLGSVVNGGSSLLSSDKPNMMTGIDAQSKNNATMLSRINSGSTLLGRAGSIGQMILTGETTADSNERVIKGMEEFNSALDAIGKRASGEMVKSDVTSGSLGIGNYSANYKKFKAALEAAVATNSNTVTFFDDTSGTNQTISMEDAQRQIGYLLKTNENSYIEKVVNGSIDDAIMNSQIIDAQEKAVRLQNTGNASLDSAVATYFSSGKFEVSDRDSVKKTQDAISINVTKAKRENVKHVANRRGQGNKGN